jgi:hypothetical protein
MSHVDEGTVHAYLDHALEAGERLRVERHIAECAECATLLHAEERVRESAASLLLRAVPGDIATPPFARVQARSAGAPARWHVPRLAWAAMLVIGLGSAIMTARVIRVDHSPAESMNEAAPAAAAVAPASPEQPSLAPRPEVAAQERAGTGAGTPPDMTEPNVRRKGVAPPSAGGVLAESDASARPAMEKQRAAESRELAEGQQAGRRDAADVAQFTIPADKRAADALAAAPAAPRPAPAPPPPAPATPPPAAPVNFPSGAVAGAAGGAAAAWRASTQAEAEELLGASLARVRGVELLSVEVLPVEPPLIRVRQPLGAVVLELTQQRVSSNLLQRAQRDEAASRSLRNSAMPAEGNTSGAAAKATTPSATVRRGDVMITAQAPLTADSLAALLRRIE